MFGDGAVEGVGTLSRVAGELVGCGGAVACFLSALIGCASGRHCLADAGLGAGVYILDIVGVLRLKLIELICAILQGSNLTIYPLLACQGAHMSPEAFLRLHLQGLASGISS